MSMAKYDTIPSSMLKPPDANPLFCVRCHRVTSRLRVLKFGGTQPLCGDCMEPSRLA